MGQGTHTKIAQLVANTFGLPFEKVKISSTNTSKVPNTSASAASSTTDLNGAATLNAAGKIKKNLNDFIREKYKIYSKLNLYIKMKIFILEIDLLILKNNRRSLFK